MQELTQDMQPIRQLRNSEVNSETAHPTAWMLPFEIFTSLAQWKNTSTQAEHKMQLWLWQQLTHFYTAVLRSWWSDGTSALMFWETVWKIAWRVQAAVLLTSTLDAGCELLFDSLPYFYLKHCKLHVKSICHLWMSSGEEFRNCCT